MRAKLLTIVLILLLSVVAVAIIKRALDGTNFRGLASQTLADGKIVTIEDITFGTNHVFVHGSKFLADIKTHLPPGVQKWLGSQFLVRHYTTERSLIIWYTVFDPATQQYVYGNPNGFRIVDDHGCVQHIGSYGTDGSDPKFSVHHVYADVFPRRQKSFVLRGKFMSNPEVEFKIPNRFRTPRSRSWSLNHCPLHAP